MRGGSILILEQHRPGRIRIFAFVQIASRVDLPAAEGPTTGGGIQPAHDVVRAGAFSSRSEVLMQVMRTAARRPPAVPSGCASCAA